MNFKPGQALVITPKDTDDPVAVGLSGMTVTFRRLSYAGHAVVELPQIGTKPPHQLVLRLQDLREKRDEKK